MAAGTRGEDPWHGTVGSSFAVAPRFRFLVGPAASQADAFHQHAVYEGGQWAALFMREDMKINPTSTRRIVVIEIQTGINDEDQASLKAATGTEVITCIQLIADDGVQVIEAVFSGAPERVLLRDFWGAVRRGDVFYGYQVMDRLALVSVLDLLGESRDATSASSGE
jgi:hypothetical protein